MFGYMTLFITAKRKQIVIGDFHDEAARTRVGDQNIHMRRFMSGLTA